MGIGFKGGFAAFMDGYNKAEEKQYNRDRQIKEDAWVQGQRDVKLREQARDDALRQDLSASVGDKVASVEQHGPLVQQQGVDVPLPSISQPRALTQEEQRRNAAQAYLKAGKVAEGFAHQDAASQLGMQDYANKFNQLRASAQDLPIKDQVLQAIQIFNDAPNAGTIGEPRFDVKTGAVTFDAYNKVTGQKVTKTFADPKKLIDDFHAYYSQKSWLDQQEKQAAAQAEAAKEGRQTKVLGANAALVNNAGKVLAYGPRAGEGGGGGGSGGSGGGRAGGDSGEAGAQQLPAFDVNKVALDRWKDLTRLQEDPQFSGVKQTPQELQKQAMQEALSMRGNVYDNFKRERQEGVIHQIMAPSRNSAMDVGSKEYADLYQKLQQAKGQAIPRQYLESIGYPYPTMWERPARSGPSSQK